MLVSYIIILRIKPVAVCYAHYKRNRAAVYLCHEEAMNRGGVLLRSLRPRLRKLTEGL